MAGTIILDFMADPLSGVTLIEQLSHQDWVDDDVQHRRMNFVSSTHPQQLVTSLAQELPPNKTTVVIFNLPTTASLGAQIIVVGAALLGELPHCVHLLYPANTPERDSASPYRLVGMLPLEAAQRLGQQTNILAPTKGNAKVVVNLSSAPHHANDNATELHLPLHEHKSVASQMSAYVSKLSIKEWRSALVVLPQSSSLAALAVCFLQGLTGRWPNISVDGPGGERIVILEALYKLAARNLSNRPDNDLARSNIGWQVASSANLS